MLGIAGYEPQWHHDAEALAAAHRTRFRRIVGRELTAGWLMWHVGERSWFADGPVVLDFGGVQVEILHRTFDECAVTWHQVDLSRPIDGFAGALRLAWRPDPHAALRRARGRPLRRVNVVERLLPARWRPRALHAVEFLFDGARLAVYNAMDENGLDDLAEAELPVAAWRRVPIA